MAIESVTQSDSLEEGRVKWNSNDSELHLRLTTSENISPSYVNSFTGSKTSTTGGFLFDLTSQVGAGYELLPGSVRVSVNGVVYTSNEIQNNAAGTDYYIHSSGSRIVFKNTATGGTLDLIDDDVVVITFRRRLETGQGNQAG